MDLIGAPQVDVEDAESEVSPAPVRTRVRLTNHEVRSETTVHGKSAAAFGSLFLGVGAFIVLLALDVIHAPDSDFNAPRGLVALIGAAFGLPGLWLTLHGLGGMYRAVLRRNRLARHPDQPWRADHPWDERGETRTTWRGAWQSFKGVVVFSAFLVPFQWFMLQDERMWFFWLVIGFFDLVVLGLLCQAVLRAVRALRYGRSHVRYDWFPFHVGEGVSLRFAMTRPRAFDTLRLTLRAVEEAYEERGSGSDSSTRVVPYCLHEETREMTGDAARLRPGGELAVEFDVPVAAPATELAARPPTYWELTVRGETAGADYREVFLVPVYGKPR